MSYKVQAVTSTVTMVETTACSINGLPNPTGPSAGRREEEVGEVKGAQERAEEEEDEG